MMATTITLDIPLLLIGLLSLLWIRVSRPDYYFQVACQFVGTFWAQYSYIVSWSLAKLVPFLSATSLKRERVAHGILFLPFLTYVIITGLIFSLFWHIPTNVEYTYGEGRIWIQLVTFFMLVLTTRAFAIAMSNKDGPMLMWKALILASIVHGVASIYQYIAALFNLPFIGISRAHDLTLEQGVADIAAFEFNSGVIVLRPGGLAGEPKTAAVIFGINLFTGLLSRIPPGIPNKWIYLSNLSIAMSALGFIGAFSTSAIISFSIAYIAFLTTGLARLTKFFKQFFITILLFICIDFLLGTYSLPSLRELLLIRSVDRVGSENLDEPVEAALRLMSENPDILFFGTGIGGGSFYIMDYLGHIFQYALTPNVGLIALLLEFGLTGTLLMLAPFVILATLTIRNSNRYVDWQNNWQRRFLLILGLSTMLFMLGGSGIALGYPLAIGSILAASQQNWKARQCV